MNTKATLSIGGLDPSGGAGILADIKTFNGFESQGFGVATAITYQNGSKFEGVDWLPMAQIKAQLLPLFDGQYSIEVVKIGLVEGLQVLNELIDFLVSHLPAVRIIWDPVVKASAGFMFHAGMDKDVLQLILGKVYLVTPNLEEAAILARSLGLNDLGDYPGRAYIVLKGGHGVGDHAEDVLFHKGKKLYALQGPRVEGKSIHGSGCVFASGLAAALATGMSLEDAFAKAKKYVYQLLNTSGSQLAAHYKVKI